MALSSDNLPLTTQFRLQTLYANLDNVRDTDELRQMCKDLFLQAAHKDQLIKDLLKEQL